MKRRDVTAGLGALAWLAPAPWARGAVSESDAAAGVRAALQRGALAAIAELGHTDGFMANPKVRIPLPARLQDAARLLKAVGQGRKVDDLEVAMNRAAEMAVPEARTLFLTTVKSISVEDAWRLVRGAPSAVTDFFAAKTRQPLSERFLPIVTRATEEVQLARRYDAVAARAGSVGLVKGDETSIERYVTARALDGLFAMMAEEEGKIRADPLATGNRLLREVFAR